jgi:hypothetical protein
MKTKQEKLAILDELIACAEKGQFGVDSELHSCVGDADMFMRRCADRSAYRKWQKDAVTTYGRLNYPVRQVFDHAANQTWSDEQRKQYIEGQQRVWEYSKVNFINALLLYRKELELYGEDGGSTYDMSDPLEILRRQYNELINELRDDLEELENRLEDIESLIEDAENRAEEIANSEI